MDNEQLRPFVAPEAQPYLDSICAMLNAPFCVALGLTPVRIGRDAVVLQMRIRPQDRNSNGFAHGGAIYGLMDHAYAILTNIDGHAVGQSSYESFYRPGRGDLLTAEARFINASKSLYTVEVRVTDEEGKLIASGTFTAFRLQEIRK